MKFKLDENLGRRCQGLFEYIVGFPPETQTVLEELRALIKANAPGATETISYAIPTFDLKRRGKAAEGKSSSPGPADGSQ